MSNGEAIYKRLMEHIKNPIGVAALMGNMYAESGLNPINLQNSYNTKLGLSDEEYTKNVDLGIYTNFVSDSAGYGLCQWTSAGRKRALLEYTGHQVTVGDLDMQVLFCIHELKTAYPSVWNKLLKTDNIAESTEYVLRYYERPKDQSITAIQKRVGYAEKMLAMYGDTTVEDCALVSHTIDTEKLPVLRVDCRGTAVQVWQVICGVSPDGIFGSKTLNATLQMQKEMNLKTDGKVGPDTWGAGLTTLIK